MIQLNMIFVMFLLTLLARYMIFGAFEPAPRIRDTRFFRDICLENLRQLQKRIEKSCLRDEFCRNGPLFFEIKVPRAICVRIAEKYVRIRFFMCG